MSVADQRYSDAVKRQMVRERIESGAWRVDPDSGHVFGRFGKLIGARSWAGYITLAMGHRSVFVFAHRVIWEHVHGPLPEGLDINHIDGDKTNNRAENLEAVSRSANLSHAWRLGLQRAVFGERAHAAKLTDAEVAAIRRERAETGASHSQLAARFGVTRPRIGQLLRGDRPAGGPAHG